MLLSLVIWLGGVAFFPVMAQTFILETPIVAPGRTGSSQFVAEATLDGFRRGLLVPCSFTHRQLCDHRSHASIQPEPCTCRTQLTLTAVSQFAIIPGMDKLRVSNGELATLVADSPIRVQFDSLHAWSTGIEKAVLVLGLAVLYLTSRRISSGRA
jgi:hypothetical protein